jgi:hypothetical protein
MSWGGAADSIGRISLMKEGELVCLTENAMVHSDY